MDIKNYEYNEINSHVPKRSQLPSFTVSCRSDFVMLNYFKRLQLAHINPNWNRHTKEMISNRQIGDNASITLPHFPLTDIICVSNAIKGNKTAR